MKMYIRGMALSRSDLGNWIDNHTFQVMVALAQLYLFPSGTQRKHWRIEVWEKLSRMHKLKMTNRLPSADFIFKNSFGRNKGNISDALQYAKDKEHDLIPQASEVYGDFYQVVEDYFMWLAGELSHSETVVMQDVLNELDRLGLPESVDYE